MTQPLDNIVTEELRWTGEEYSKDYLRAHEITNTGIPEEFVETPEFLWDRLRIKEQGARTREDKALMPKGYDLHLIVAKDTTNGEVVGAGLGSSLPLTPMRGSVGLLCYAAVDPKYQGRGIHKRLSVERYKKIEEDSQNFNLPLLGYVAEVEFDNHEEATMLRKNGFQRLDVDFMQPGIDAEKGVNAMYPPEKIQLFYRPAPNGVTPEMARHVRFSPDLIRAIGRAIFRKEYVENPLKDSIPYQMYLESIEGRDSIGFKPPYKVNSKN